MRQRASTIMRIFFACWCLAREWARWTRPPGAIGSSREWSRETQAGMVAQPRTILILPVTSIVILLQVSGHRLINVGLALLS